MIRLVENFSANKSIIQELPLTESIFTEKETGKKYETKKKYRVDVSRFTENLNKRVYSKSLWENVIKNQKNIWEGSFALADHPADEGSFKDVMGVWSNLHINEATETVRADITFVGPYGQKAIEILEAGGKIGFSSSGFGDLKEDGKTVDESTYQIERIADCVLNPSQQVYGTIKDAIEESIDNESKDTNYISRSMIKEHVKMSTNKLSKLEERKFRDSIEHYLSEIKSKINTPNKKLEELTELLSYFDEEDGDAFKDLKEKVEIEVSETRKEINEAIHKASALKETFGTDNPEDFKEGLKKLATDTQFYERQVDDWKKLAESLQSSIKSYKEELEKRPTLDEINSYKERIKAIKEKRKIKELEYIKKISKYESQLDENAKIYKEMVKELTRAIKALEESENLNKELFINNKKLVTEVKELRITSKNLKESYEEKIKNLTKLPEVKHID
ncbi:MAG TPA: hypothetical protein PKI46_06515, partial [Bacteroidales bacterium]|nr:hypothetical protein [Bacteroidales bacterium]